MGGKNYKKKGAAEGTTSSQQTGPSSAQRQAPAEQSARQRMLNLNISQQTASNSGQQQSQVQQGGRPQTQQTPPGGRQQQQQGQQGGRPQQQQGAWSNRPQPQMQGQAPQGAWGRDDKPRQTPQQQGPSQGAWGRDDKPRQTPQPQGPRTNLPRAESVQSVQSVHSEKSSGSSQSKSGGRQQPPQKQGIDPKLLENVDKLFVDYKGPGKKGRRLGEIEANYLKLSLNNLVDYAYHYDVKFEPDRPKKFLTKVFLKFVKMNFPTESIAFDGTNNAYSANTLKIGDLKREVIFTHPETGGERKFLVSIQAAKDNQISLKAALSKYQKTRQSDDPKRTMQAMEVILKSAFHQDHLENGIQGGRSFFLRPQNKYYLGDFYELWTGLFQSMVLGEYAFLNVDVNHKGFPKRYNDLTDLLKDMNVDLNREIDNRFLYELKRHLSGLEICYNSPKGGRVYKFYDISKPPKAVLFKKEDGTTTNVYDYFVASGRRIQYPNIQCIVLGNSIKQQTVPMEFCSLPDTQVINKKCTEEQTRNIIKVAATSTDERKRKIMELVNTIRRNGSSVIKGFGIGVDKDFTKVPARQLDAPKLEYGNRRTVIPTRGVWRSDNLEFLQPCKSIAWSILNTNFRTRQNELNEFAQMLYRCCGSTGLQLASNPTDCLTFSDRDIPKIQAEMQRIGREKKIQIVFCIIPDSGPMYARLKGLAEIDYGVLTQCIKGVTVSRKRNNASTISNILLKVNAKLNGTNHKLQSSPILDGRCMLMGADVTHPSPDQKNIPSVVGVTASHDKNAFCYNMKWRLQGQRLEIIQDFKAIVKEQLLFFKGKNGFLPDKILYYRDGVSEGQFDQVMAIEKNAMVAACREVQQGYEKMVKITVVVVQKRHHTRLFPGNTGIGKDNRKNNNVSAGTIVDTVITRCQNSHL